MIQSLSGPSHGPLIEGRPSSIVVLIHGYGASGDDLIPLAYSWATSFPNTLFISPHAPFPCEQNPLGRQWMSLRDLDRERLWRDTETVIPSLNVFLNDLLTTYRLTWSQLALVGFSQGGALVLSAGLYHFPVAGVICYSGAFISSPQKNPPKKTPVLLVHGDKDEVLPLSWFKEAKKELSDFEVPFDFLVCEGLGHGINPAGLEKGAQFLKRNLKEIDSFSQGKQTL